MADQRSPLEKMSDGKLKPFSLPPRVRWLRWAPTWAIWPVGAVIAMGLRLAMSPQPWAQLSTQQRLINVALLVAAGLVLTLFRWLIEPVEKRSTPPHP
jgi:hypothetical protein